MCDQKLAVATVEAEPKSITNIYYDCLERIFDFLDLESLLNVAGTCKRLQIDAAAKYADGFEHACVVLFENGHYNNITQDIYNLRQPLIHVRGLKFCLTFLRCFGAKIFHLTLFSMLHTPNGIQRYVDRYINQYCADTLRSIFIARGRSFSSETFTNPFKAVKELSLYDCNLGDQLPNFVDWFPNLQQLSFSSDISIDDNAIAVSFPHLEHLHITLHDNSGSITIENAIKFLHANQQLQSLDILLNTEFDKLLDVISANKSVLNLRVYGGFTDVFDIQLNRLANEHPLLEELHFEILKLEVDDAIALIHQLNSLKQFEFRVKNQTDCDRFLSQLDSKWKHEIKSYQYDTSVIICLACN